MTDAETRFVDQTCLLPHVIADCIGRELASLLPAPPPADLADYLASRAVTIYGRNRRFAKRLRSNAGRDLLYAFMRHWACGELARRFGRAYLAPLPERYAMGANPP